MSGDERNEPAYSQQQHEIYLDNNATTTLDPRVLEAMTNVWRTCGANPASQHAAGRKARRLVEESRERILELLGARTSGMGADRLIFTSGGTEANHLALRGLVIPEFFPRLVALADIEHPSLRATAATLEQEAQRLVEWRRYEHEISSPSPRILRLPVLPTGMVDLQVIADQRQISESHRPQLICLMLASNETGVLQPVREVCELAQNSGMFVHTDAVQAVGKVPVDFRELGVSTMTVAPHKFHGPIGIGALVVRQGVKLQPQLLGGFQQEGLRAGTESVALAVGFRRALELAHEEFETRTKQMRVLRDEFAAILQKHLPNSIVIGQDVPRTPHTLCISFPPLDRQALVMALDLAGIACSTGSACASGSSEPSPTLVAMGLPAAVIRSAIRFSFDGFLRPLDMIDAADRIIKTVQQLQRGR